MSLPTTRGNWGPDPDNSRGDDEIGALVQRVDGPAIVAPFAAGYEGDVEAVDWAMREMLGRAAIAEHAFDMIGRIWQTLGDRAVHYNPNSVGWN